MCQTNMSAWCGLLERHTMFFFGSCGITGCGSKSQKLCICNAASSSHQSPSPDSQSLRGTCPKSLYLYLTTSILGFISSVLKSLFFSPQFLSSVHDLQSSVLCPNQVQNQYQNLNKEQLTRSNIHLRGAPSKSPCQLLVFRNQMMDCICTGLVLPGTGPYLHGTVLDCASP